MNEERVRTLVRELLAEIGEDPDREGLRRKDADKHDKAQRQCRKTS